MQLKSFNNTILLPTPGEVTILSVIRTDKNGTEHHLEQISSKDEVSVSDAPLQPPRYYSKYDFWIKIWPMPVKPYNITVTCKVVI